MSKDAKADRESITSAGEVAFRVKTGVVEVPVLEHKSCREGEGDFLVVSGIKRECVAGLREALAATKGDLGFVNELSPGLLNSLRITDVFEVEVASGEESVKRGPFRTSNDVRSKIIGVLMKVLETAGTMFEKDEKIDTVTARINPDWGCTEAVSERESE